MEIFLTAVPHHHFGINHVPNVKEDECLIRDVNCIPWVCLCI